MNGKVASVAGSEAHGFSKTVIPVATLIAGIGVEGDAHAGTTVQHLSRVRQNPDQPNLRQVHLLHAELLDELRGAGFDVAPGQLGENILTQGIALLALPRGTRLKLGASAVVELTGLRNPCGQIENFKPGLLKAVLGKDDDGRLVRKAGVMAIVVAGGDVRPGDAVQVELPALPHSPLEPV